MTRCIHTFGYRLEESELEFVNAAKECCGVQPTDKVIDHEYQLMYGMFLLPMIKRHIERNALTSSANEGVANSRKFKMLEIGLGCDMKYGMTTQCMYNMNTIYNTRSMYKICLFVYTSTYMHSNVFTYLTDMCIHTFCMHACTYECAYT